MRQAYLEAASQITRRGISMSDQSQSCTICGGTSFVPGPLGRMAAKGKLAPRCESCNSLERHRILRQVYDAIPSDVLSKSRALQFANDPSAPRDRFASFEVSQYEVENSLDMAAIDRADNSYDWVIANHVLEHVEDDHKAITELRRIVTDEGVIQLTVPAPSAELETWDLPGPLPTSFGHWRGYGSDFALHFKAELEGCYGLQVIGHDTATPRWDVAYLFTNSRDTMLTIGSALIDAGLPTLRCV